MAGLTIVGIILRSVFPRIMILAWTAPDFLLIITVFNAMFHSAFHGGVTGFVIGLAEDLFFGRFIGLNAMAKCVVGILSGSLSKSIFKENIWVPVMNVFTGSILSLFIVYTAGHLAGARWHIMQILYQSMFEVVCNVCLVPFLYGPFFHYADRLIHKDT
ncbi:MAG: rod shape-determining protein MreD [Clostridiales bacterium]|nr:rod shape-determining protein MreD [Clostridiales bacterium]